MAKLQAMQMSIAPETKAKELVQEMVGLIYEMKVQRKAGDSKTLDLIEEMAAFMYNALPDLRKVSRGQKAAAVRLRKDFLRLHKLSKEARAELLETTKG